MKIELELQGRHSLVTLANDATLLDLYRVVQDVFWPELVDGSTESLGKTLPFHLYYKAEKTYCLRSLLEWEELRQRPIDRLEISVRMAEVWPLFMQASQAAPAVCPCHNKPAIKAVSLLDGSAVKFESREFYEPVIKQEPCGSSINMALHESCIFYNGERLKLDTDLPDAFCTKVYARVYFRKDKSRGTVLGARNGELYVEIDSDCTSNGQYEIRCYSRQDFIEAGGSSLSPAYFSEGEERSCELAIQQSLYDRIARLHK